MTATPLPRRVRSITRPRLDKLLSDLDVLDTAIGDLAVPKDDLLCNLDDWNTADDSEERAEYKEAAENAAEELIEVLAEVVTVARSLIGAGPEPQTASTVPPAKKHPPSSPLGLLATIYRSNYPADDPSPADRIDALAHLRRLLDEEEQQLAFHLRSHGTTWQTIADLWGLASRQRAQQRFGAADLLDRLDAAAGRPPQP